MGLLKNLLLPIFLLTQCFSGSAQEFCASNFGNSWVIYAGVSQEIKSTDLDTSVYAIEDSIYQMPNLDSLFFDKDTINFLRSRFYSNFQYIKLNCNDSTYTFWVTEGIPIEQPECGIDTVYFTGTANTRGGQWKTTGDRISFKPSMGNHWFHFNIQYIGTKEPNKTILWTSTGDYRTSIRLVRIE